MWNTDLDLHSEMVIDTISHGESHDKKKGHRHWDSYPQNQSQIGTVRSFAIWLSHIDARQAITPERHTVNLVRWNKEPRHRRMPHREGVIKRLVRRIAVLSLEACYHRIRAVLTHCCRHE